MTKSKIFETAETGTIRLQNRIISSATCMGKFKFLLFAIAILFFACTENKNPDVAAEDNDSGAMTVPATQTVFIENFDGNEPKKLENFYFASGGNKAEWAWKTENGILKAAMDPADKAGAWNGQNFVGEKLSHFGRYSARIKIPSAETQPNVGGVVGFYTYYNDENSGGILPKDENKNGLVDNSEIDFEWLIANPQIIYLTAWTDYQEKGGIVEFRKVSRIINLATGKIYSTTYAENWEQNIKLTGVENQPETIAAIPDYDASKNFYTYGFDWKSDNIRWWMINPKNSADTITLWDYKGKNERITQKQAYLSLNIWHTNNWPAEEKPGSTEAPKDIFWMEFDWVKYEIFVEK